MRTPLDDDSDQLEPLKARESFKFMLYSYVALFLSLGSSYLQNMLLTDGNMVALFFIFFSLISFLLFVVFQIYGFVTAVKSYKNNEIPTAKRTMGILGSSLLFVFILMAIVANVMDLFGF